MSKSSDPFCVHCMIYVRAPREERGGSYCPSCNQPLEIDIVGENRDDALEVHEMSVRDMGENVEDS